ncbi:MAG TPA: SPOR domain-containing protein [Steroidobacteraceae bacterium]|nr:SPOR domain-containing protein [Steroidobacteraceae bacterium]
MNRYAWLAVLLVAGCGADRDYQAAERANTVVAFDDYLRLHPDGAHAREARAHLAVLVEEREWQRAHTADTADAYQQYLRGYPDGQHAHDAQAAIANLKLAATPTTEAAAQPPPSGAASPAGSAIVPPATGSAKGAIARAPSPTPGAASPSAVTAGAPSPPSKAPPPATPVPGTAASTDHPDPRRGFRVQLGAFAQGSRAAVAWQRLVRRHPDLATRRPLIAAARTADGRQVHRLQLGGFDRESAETLCRALVATHEACIVVPPPKTGRS